MKSEQGRHVKPCMFLPVLMAACVAISGCATTTAADRESNEGPTAAQSIEAGDEVARRGDFERALVHYIDAASKENSAEIWLRIGAAAKRLNDSERALDAYLRVIEIEPMQADALEGAGLELVAFGDSAAARAHLEQAVQLDPQRWRSHNALGILDDEADDHASAIKHYEAALDIHPNSPLVLNNLGYSRFLSNDLDQAARDLYAATELDPGHARARANLALVYAHQGWYADAVQTLLKVSDEATAYNDVGYIAFQRGDLEEAAALLSEAVRISPKFFEAAYRNLEMVRARLGQSIQTLPTHDTAIRDLISKSAEPVVADER